MTNALMLEKIHLTPSKINQNVIFPKLCMDFQTILCRKEGTQWCQTTGTGGTKTITPIGEESLPRCTSAKILMEC